MCHIFQTQHQTRTKYDQLTKNEQLLVRKQYKVLGNDEVDVNNQMSRKYKEGNTRSYLKRFNSLVALMPTLRAGLSVLMYKEQS